MDRVDWISSIVSIVSSVFGTVGSSDTCREIRVDQMPNRQGFPGEEPPLQFRGKA